MPVNHAPRSMLSVARPQISARFCAYWALSVAPGQSPTCRATCIPAGTVKANTARHVRPQLHPRDPVTILDACCDPHLFGPWFTRRESWRAWFVFLAALFGLKMTPSERKLFTQHTGRTQPPRTQAREGWLV